MGRYRQYSLEVLTGVQGGGTDRGAVGGTDRGAVGRYRQGCSWEVQTGVQWGGTDRGAGGRY